MSLYNALNVLLEGSNLAVCVERRTIKGVSAQSLHLTALDSEIGLNTKNSKDRVYQWE